MKPIRVATSMKENNGQERLTSASSQRPKFARRLSSSCETPRATNAKQFTFADVSSPPSMEASLDCSSASCLAADERHGLTSNSESLKALSKQTMAPSSPTDEGCMTDRMVRFFCPFGTTEEPSRPQTSTTRKQSTAAADSNPHIMQNSPYATCSTKQACSGDWLKPVQSCIPKKWDNSPERSSLAGRRLNIRNRCSTLEANERKSEYIHQMRKQWHSHATAPVPLRSSRSEAAAKHQHRPPTYIKMPSMPSTASVFYDSDPEVVASTSRYKRNRPTSLNLDVKTEMDTDASEFECPRVSRHSAGKLNSFFESPRSVTGTPDFDDDAAVREFIQVATEQRVNLVWHQAPYSHDDGSSSSQQLPQPAPISITGWFESGSQLDNNSVLFPKFVWRQAFQSGTSLISRTPDDIQLLTIVGVVTPSSLDRRAYPFARLDRSCCITTHNGKEYVFEASCEEERDLFVNRLKVFVSRLAASVIVHDEGMLREFFSPAGTESFADNLSVDCQSNEDNNTPPSTELPQPMRITVDTL